MLNTRLRPPLAFRTAGCLGAILAAAFAGLQVQGAPAGPAAPAAGEAAPAGPEQAAPAKKPLSAMTEEEILKLPPFHRFDIPWDEGVKLLDDVKDKTYDYDEAAFYWLVAQVAKMPDADFTPDEEAVPYDILLAVPSSYRGKLVTIRGVYVNVTPWRVPVIALSKDVPYLYTCNIKQLPLRDTSLIATVVVLDDPMLRFERGDEVEVKGYFYKVRAYADEAGTERLAPMLVAKRLEPGAGITLSGRGMVGPSSRQVFLALIIGLTIVLFIAFILVRRIGRSKTDAKSGRLPHRIRLRRPDQPPPFAEGGAGDEGGGEKPENRSGH